ncbi:hypothetical protein GGS20DRAFT_573923, partial [Poronia punctata]
MAEITPVISGVTRTNLGPFTTNTWTFSCTEVIQNDDSGWAAQTCIIDRGDNNRPTDNQECWPPRTDGVPATTEALAGWGVYSPGLFCPDGYTSVAGQTHGGTSDFDFQFPLTAGETAVGCCPKGGYRPIFDYYSKQTCVQFQPTTTFLVGTCNGYTPAYTPFAIPGTLGEEEYNSFSISAPLFQMVYRESDIPVTSSSSSIPTSTSNNLFPSSSSSSTGGFVKPQTQGNTDEGLSTGAVAGIAVGGALGVILALTAGFCIWRRRDKKKKRNAGLLPQVVHSPLPPYGGDYYKTEYIGPGGKEEPVMADSIPVSPPAEMPANDNGGWGGNQPAELAPSSNVYY